MIANTLSSTAYINSFITCNEHKWTHQNILGGQKVVGKYFTFGNF